MNLPTQSERPSAGATVVTSPRIRAAEAHWQGLRDALERLPPTRFGDPARFHPAATVAATLKFLRSEPPGRMPETTSGEPVVAGAIAAIQDADNILRHDWVHHHCSTMLDAQAPVSGVQHLGSSPDLEWLMLPFSEDGIRVDTAVVIGESVVGTAVDLPHSLEELLVATADRKEIGIVAINSDGTIRFINATARRLLSAGRAFAISRAGKLIAHTEAADRLLRFERKSKSARAVINDLAYRAERFQAGTLLSIRRLNVFPGLDNAACEVFGLRAAEARVAIGIASGLTTAEIAVEAGISLNTARTQLKAAMARMGVTRQQELVRRLCLLAVL